MNIKFVFHLVLKSVVWTMLTFLIGLILGMIYYSLGSVAVLVVFAIFLAIAFRHPEFRKWWAKAEEEWREVIEENDESKEEA